MSLSKFYSSVRNHPYYARIVPILISMAISVMIFGVGYADEAATVKGFFESTDAYWGYALGSTSGFGFGEWLHGRAWKARDYEMDRLRKIETEHNNLRNDALKEKLKR